MLHICAAGVVGSVQVILMNNTGLADEEQLRVVRNEVKTIYHTESAMWASFKTEGEDGGRGVAVLVLGPLAPRTGWIRSDSRGHILSASSRVKPGLPVLSFVACDLAVPSSTSPAAPPSSEEQGQGSSSVEDIYSKHVEALREMMHSEQEKGAYLLAGGQIVSSEHPEASAYHFSDLGIHSLQNRMKMRGGSPDSVDTTTADDVFVSLHTKTDDPFGIKIAASEMVGRSAPNEAALPRLSSLIAVTVGGWPQETFIKQQKGARSPDVHGVNRKSRSRPNSAPKQVMAAPPPPRYALHYDSPGGSVSTHGQYASPYLDSTAPYRPSQPLGRDHQHPQSLPSRYHQQQMRQSPPSVYDRSAPHRPVPALPRDRDSHITPTPRPTDSISTLNDLLSWRLSVLEGLNSLERTLTTTQWGVIRLDQLKSLLLTVLYKVDDMPNRVGNPGFADSASISVLKSLLSTKPESMLESGPEIISQVLKTWHASADHTIHRISS